jgi:hypothetical protein
LPQCARGHRVVAQIRTEPRARSAPGRLVQDNGIWSSITVELAEMGPLGTTLVVAGCRPPNYCLQLPMARSQLELSSVSVARSRRLVRIFQLARHTSAPRTLCFVGPLNPSNASDQTIRSSFVSDGGRAAVWR